MDNYSWDMYVFHELGGFVELRWVWEGIGEELIKGFAQSLAHAQHIEVIVYHAGKRVGRAEKDKSLYGMRIMGQVVARGEGSDTMAYQAMWLIDPADSIDGFGILHRSESIGRGGAVGGAIEHDDVVVGVAKVVKEFTPSPCIALPSMA